MKVYFKNSLTNKQATNKGLNSRQYEFDEHRIDIKKYNTTGPAKAISFSGSVISAAQSIGADNKISKAGKIFLENKFLNRIINFVADNEAAYTAVYSMLIAGLLKPLLVLKTKDADEKDKQMIATKNFLQAFLGSFLSFTISGKIIKKAVDITKNNISLLEVSNNLKINVKGKESKEVLELAEEILKKEGNTFKEKKEIIKNAVKENTGIRKIAAFFKTLFKKIEFIPTKEAIEQKAAELVETCKEHKKIFEKNPKLLKDILDKVTDKKSGTALNEAYDSLWKNFAGAPVAIAKAKIASLLLPTVVAFIFAKKSFEAQQNQNENRIITPLTASSGFKDTKKEFDSYLNKKTPIAFKGSISNNAIETLSKIIEHASVSNAGDKFVRGLTKLPKPSARMSDLESVLLTAWWVQNTSRSKKIAPDQKLGLNVQSILVTIVSSATAFLIDLLLDGLIEKGKKNYAQTIENNIKNLANEISQGKEISNLQEAIKESCKKLNDAENIAKTFLKNGADINNSQQVKEIAKKLAGSYGKKLSKFKSLTIFTLVVRFLVPVLMVKPAGKIKQKIKLYKEKKEQNIKKLQEETKNQKI